MKKLILIITMLTNVVFICGRTPVAPNLLNSGHPNSQDNPYLISSLDNLAWIIALDVDVSTPDRDERWAAHYRQVNDIDAIGTHSWYIGEYLWGWEPIGQSINHPFSGSYDGNNFKISNLYSAGVSLYSGLFGYISTTAEILNLGVENIEIQDNADDYVGAIAGYSMGTITNCYSSGYVKGYQGVGGLVGANLGTITKCYSTADVDANLGGMGGLVGVNHGAKSIISYSYSSGTVAIEYSAMTTAAGGLVGKNEGTINNSYSRSKIQQGNTHLGGFVGSNYGVIDKCYSTGTVNGYGLKGGFVGNNDASATITNSYWDIESSGFTTSAGNATGKTRREMQMIQTYQSWQFYNANLGWKMHPAVNGGYPSLWWQEEAENFAIVPSQGNGNQDNPYLIESLNNLYWINQHTDYLDKHYKQTQNIDATETINWHEERGWLPLGTENLPFTGVYDGQGFTIDNLYINRPSFATAFWGKDIGLFGVINQDAELVNLGVLNANVRGTNRVGALLGTNNKGNVLYCFSSGEVGSFNILTGGLIGLNTEGIIHHSYSRANVTRLAGSGTSFGAFIGRNDRGAVNYSYSTGKVYQEPGVIWNENNFKNKAFAGDVISGGGYQMTYNYFDEENSEQNSTAGEATGLRTLQMLRQVNYPNWTFSGAYGWRINPLYNDGYPIIPAQVNGLNYAVAPLENNGKYEIKTLQNLFWITQDVNRWGFDYIQKNDIDAQETVDWYGGKGWLPIGYWQIISNNPLEIIENYFTGTYNAQGNEIQNLFINRPNSDDIGFFGAVKNINTKIEKLAITNADITGKNRVGTIVGSNFEGLIENCNSTGNVVSIENVAGLLVGGNYSNISKSYAIGTVSGLNTLGGLAGINSNNAMITDSYARVNVYRVSGSGTAVASFVGNNFKAKILRCYTTGAVRYNNASNPVNKGFAGAINTEGIFEMSDNYFDSETTFQNSSACTAVAKSSELMKSEIFNNWDWNNVWERIGNNYPRLKSNPDQTLPVTLSSFTATYTSSSIVSILWETHSESNLIGYHILRSEKNDINIAIRLTNQIITANNQPETSQYSFTDHETEANSEYYYWLMSSEYDGTVDFYGPVSVKTSIIFDEIPTIPLVTQLNSAYPNPFNPSTTISFDLSEMGIVMIEIYNIKGQKVKNLLNDIVLPGRHNIVWNGLDDNRKVVSSGVYFYKMQAGNYIKINKMIMIK